MQARRKLCTVYDEESLIERQCQRWFARFRSGDFSVKDAPQSQADHLFRSLQNSLKRKKLDSDEATKRYLDQFIADKDRRSSMRPES